MFTMSICNKPLMCRVYSGWMVAALMLLGGCSSPSFLNPPPNSYLVPLPGAINGTWANEVENGERVRLAGQPDGTLKLYFSNVDPSHNEAPVAPLLAQTMHFDNTDWLLLDWNKMAVWQGKNVTEKMPFRLLKIVLENPDRLCGIEINTRVFAEAIDSGKLTGKVDRSFQQMPERKELVSAAVTSPGADWVKWWSALPESKKSFGPSWCFLRAK